jgi:hypothetical protein
LIVTDFPRQWTSQNSIPHVNMRSTALRCNVNNGAAQIRRYSCVPIAAATQMFASGQVFVRHSGSRGNLPQVTSSQVPCVPRWPSELDSRPRRMCISHSQIAMFNAITTTTTTTAAAATMGSSHTSSSQLSNQAVRHPSPYPLQ